jgi:3'(2'), 5'-bisphosphate nucleotidase
MTHPFYKNREHDRLAHEFAVIAVRAGAAILEVYRGDFDVRLKADRTPVTLADDRAEAIILPALARLASGVPVISEESYRPSTERGAMPGTTLLLVDPLDGTREFLSRNGEFTVNIALVRDGIPVAGCVYAPAAGLLFCAGERAWRLRVGDPVFGGMDSGALESGSTFTLDTAVAEPIIARVPPPEPVALVSRSHRDPQTERWLAGAGPLQFESVGSSIKFCRIAEGAADLYPRFGPTMEWDTAAGHAVLVAAGGSVAAPDGSPLRYGKFDQGLRNGPFIARGRPR